MKIWDTEERDFLFNEAVKTGNLAKVREMIGAGVNINRTVPFSDLRPLDVAVEERQVKIVRILLEAGACPNSGLSGRPLEYAACRGDIEIAQMLIRAGARVSLDNGNALTVAATAGHLDMVQLLVEAGSNLNFYSALESRWWTIPLMCAAREGHQAVFEYLAPLTAPDLRKEAEQVALHLAASEGKIEALQLLFNAGTDLNSKDSFGQTALMIAAQQRQPQFVQTLLQMGVDISARDNEGRTALMFAAQSRYITTVKILIRADADVNAKDMEDNTALIYAEQAKDQVIAKLLRDAGATED